MHLRLLLSVGMMIGGLVLGIGGMYLLATQKFVRGTDNATEVEIPIFGRIKTNYPSLASCRVIGNFSVVHSASKITG